jgi:hypothetical protein
VAETFGQQPIERLRNLQKKMNEVAAAWNSLYKKTAGEYMSANPEFMTGIRNMFACAPELIPHDVLIATANAKMLEITGTILTEKHFHQLLTIIEPDMATIESIELANIEFSAAEIDTETSTPQPAPEPQRPAPDFTIEDAIQETTLDEGDRIQAAAIRAGFDELTALEIATLAAGHPKKPTPTKELEQLDGIAKDKAKIAKALAVVAEIRSAVPV